MQEPYAILATHVVCAETDEEAARLATTVELNFVRRAKGEYLPLASPEEAAAYDYTPVDRARIAQNRSRLTVGSPATVKARLEPLIEATKADELMVTTMIFDHEARKRSYELLKRGVRCCRYRSSRGRAEGTCSANDAAGQTCALC